MAHALRVDPGNAAQLEAWDGGEGAYWAANADRFDRGIEHHAAAFRSAAAIRTGERVLDVGCGTGASTLDAARAAAPAGVLGIDLSRAMLDVARARASRYDIDNCEFLRADAQVHQFDDGSFDVVIARTAAMFFADHATAFENLRSALTPGGRIVLLTWQPLEANEWLREIAGALAGPREPRLPPPGCGPFSLSDPKRIDELLSASGWTEVEIVPSEGPMWFGETAHDATEFILGLNGWMLDGLSERDRGRAIAALAATAAARETSGGVNFASATWITVARA